MKKRVRKEESPPELAARMMFTEQVQRVEEAIHNLKLALRSAWRALDAAVPDPAALPRKRQREAHAAALRLLGFTEVARGSK